MPVRDQQIQEEAVSALQALGFQKTQIFKAMQQVFRAHPDVNQVEELIKHLLKQLAS